MFSLLRCHKKYARSLFSTIWRRKRKQKSARGGWKGRKINAWQLPNRDPGPPSVTDLQIASYPSVFLPTPSSLPSHSSSSRWSQALIETMEERRDVIGLFLSPYHSLLLFEIYLPMSFENIWSAIALCAEIQMDLRRIDSRRSSKISESTVCHTGESIFQ